MITKLPFFFTVICALSCGTYTRVACGAILLEQTSFPKTIADVSVVDRRINKTIGYEPFKEASAYVPISIEVLQSIEKRMAQDVEKFESEPETYGYFNETEESVNDADVAVVPDKERPETNSASPQNTPQQSHLTPNHEQNQNNNTVTFDNHTHNGPCTPSGYSSERGRVDEILTSGRYESTDPAFEKAMVQIFRLEGGCSFSRVNGQCQSTNGTTSCYGYERAYWWNTFDFCSFTRSHAEDITYNDFYKTYNIDKLPDSVRGDVLRGDFHFGSGTGIKLLQQAVGVNQTGRVNDSLIRATENYNGDLHNKFWDVYWAYVERAIQNHPSWERYKRGWAYGVKLFRENGCHVVPIRPLYR